MRVIELFAGAGGAALGLHRAGFRSVVRVEWDKDACATLRAAAEVGYLDPAEVIERDVRAVDWSPYVGVDALWASPPCQDWSIAGKREGASGERNGWPWTFDVIDQLQPKWMIAENVTGLLMHRGDCDGRGAPEDCPGCYFHRFILPEMAKRFPSVQWAELNSSSFGVPQHRRRVFIVAGPRAIAWPKPTHGDPAALRQGGLFAAPLLPWETVGRALGLGLGLIAQRSPETARSSLPQSRRPMPLDAPSDAVQAGSPMIIYKRGRDDGAHDEAHTVDEPACALRGAPGGSSQPFILDPKHPPVPSEAVARPTCSTSVPASAASPQPSVKS